MKVGREIMGCFFSINSLIIFRIVMLRQYSLQELSLLVRQQYGCYGQIKQLGGYQDRNYLIQANTTSQKYVIKISNRFEKELLIQMQNYVFKNIKEHFQNKTSCRFPQLVLTLKGQEMMVIEEHGNKNFVRLFKYIEGIQLWDVPELPDTIFQDIGRLVAQLSAFLESINSHKIVEELVQTISMQEYSFNLLTFRKLYENNHKYLKEDIVHLVDETNEDFAHVLGLLEHSPRQLLHYDICLSNLLVRQEKGTYFLSGLIDFSNMVYSHRIIELAIACARTNMHREDPLRNILTIITAYHEVRGLSGQERLAIFPLIKLRLSFLCLHSCRLVCEDNNQYTRRCNSGHMNYLKLIGSAASNQVFLAKLDQIL